MLYEKRPDPSANVGAVLTGLTGAQKTWLSGSDGDPAGDAEGLAALDAISGIAKRAIVELDLGKSLDGKDPYGQAYELKALVKFVVSVTSGHGMLPGLQAHRAWTDWKTGDGVGETATFDDLCDRLRGVLRLREAAAAAEQAARKRGAQAPAPRTNADILAEELARTLGRAAPKGPAAKVKAILVLGGQAYRGHSSGGGLLQITYDLISARVQKMEDWSTTGCAEAYALDNWVHQQGFATAAAAYDALRTAPVAFPDGRIAAMDARSVHGSAGRFWVKRMPCENCQQWLKALGITADRTGNFS